MGSISLGVRYRPIRIGWCIESREIEHVKQALEFTHAFAGGRHNPLIPVDQPDLAELLIDRFAVDLLFPVASTSRTLEFVDAHKYLPWPRGRIDLFFEGTKGEPGGAAFVDICSAARSLRGRRGRRQQMLLARCTPKDPLATVLLASTGQYPRPSLQVPDYEELIERLIGVERITLREDQALPEELCRSLTPTSLTTLGLRPGRGLPEHGVYVGDAQNIEDVVHFWNIRAAGSELLFYDPAFATRFLPWLNEHKRWLASVRKRGAQQDGEVTVYSRGENHHSEDLSAVASRLHRVPVRPESWNGLNLKPAMYGWKEQSVLAFVDEREPTPSLSFALPRKPIDGPGDLSQQCLAVSVRGSDPYGQAADATFFPPYIPELNDFYGRRLLSHPARVRAEPGSFQQSVAILVEDFQTDLTFRALPTAELVERLFERFGMQAKPSRAGLVTNRLIRQMGGLQGCRVFKIEGVRSLIRKYAPDQSFNRTDAVTTIGKADEQGRPRFDAFENLFIEPRRQGKLKPEHAFLFLLGRGVFRVGMEPKCDHCELAFWQSLDDLRTVLECTYCGSRFGITGQLRDRNWAYRRSGLFGRNDDQHGGIPVALALQQLDTELRVSGHMSFATSLEVSPAGAAIARCETDFLVIARGQSLDFPHHPQLVVGECKSDGGTITETDAANLARVADAFPTRRFSTFVLFAKTGKFSKKEIAACARAKDRWRSRVIVLSKDELEPYDTYSRHEDLPRLHATGLEHLAEVTSHLYPELRPT